MEKKLFLISKKKIHFIGLNKIQFGFEQLERIYFTFKIPLRLDSKVIYVWCSYYQILKMVLFRYTPIKSYK